MVWQTIETKHTNCFISRNITGTLYMGGGVKENRIKTNNKNIMSLFALIEQKKWKTGKCVGKLKKRTLEKENKRT